MDWDRRLLNPGEGPTPRGVPYPIGMGADKAAKLLLKAAGSSRLEKGHKVVTKTNVHSGMKVTVKGGRK